MRVLALSVAEFSMLPTACMLIGSIIGATYRPGPKLSSATQHIAAGVIFAAVAKELLPKLGGPANTLPLVIGFSLGVLLMLSIKYLTEPLTHGHNDESPQRQVAQHTQAPLPMAMLSAVGVDLLIDGLLIGIAFLVGEQGGILISIALAIEILFLGLSTASALNKQNIQRAKQLLIAVILALLIPAGALVGVTVFSYFSSTITAGVLAFGVAALLYLVTEELLTEAHEVKETPWITACFFLGFLAILLLESAAT